MGKRTIFPGMRFGRLTAIRQVARRHWLFRCDCGDERAAQVSNVTAGSTRSCGCLLREVAGHHTIKHGMHGTPEYRAWRNMIARCEYPNVKNFPDYGGRGIRVCTEWRHDFDAFLNHIGRRPDLRMSIDRIDVNGNYEPGNVRWATPEQQSQNRRNVIAARARRAA